MNFELNPEYQKYREQIEKEAFSISKKKTRERMKENAKEYCLLAIASIWYAVLVFIAFHFIFKYW